MLQIDSIYLPFQYRSSAKRQTKTTNLVCTTLDTTTNAMVSIARSLQVRKLVKTVADNGNIPTVQVLFQPWTYARGDNSMPGGKLVSFYLGGGGANG